MKTRNRHLRALAAVAATVALTGSALGADHRIHIVGATAFRKAANATITSIMGSPTAQSNASIDSANAAMWIKADHPVAGDTTYVKVSWSGSAAGVQVVAATTSPTNQAKFYTDSASGVTAYDPRTSTNPAEYVVSTADLSFSDVYQSTTPFNGTFFGVTYESLQDELVGVIPFKWVASKNFPLAGGTSTPYRSNYSMDPWKAQYLFGFGSMPLAMITGSSADEDKVAFATGRDPDSGTRLTAFAESGVGTTSNVVQYKPQTTGTTHTAHAKYPATTINGVPISEGNSGESSGSTVRNYLKDRTLTAGIYQDEDNGGIAGATAGYYISYLGLSDADGVTDGSPATDDAVELKWNGATYSQADVIEGRYTFWSYEHLLYRADLATDPDTYKVTFKNALVSGLLADTAGGGIELGDMKVQRAGDGATVTATYY